MSYSIKAWRSTCTGTMVGEGRGTAVAVTEVAVRVAAEGSLRAAELV